MFAQVRADVLFTNEAMTFSGGVYFLNGLWMEERVWRYQGAWRGSLAHVSANPWRSAHWLGTLLSLRRRAVR
jgi:hypothetical protein